MLYPRPRLAEMEKGAPGTLDAVFSALRRVSSSATLAECRTYGGGLNKLEPSELARVRLAPELLEIPDLARHHWLIQPSLFPAPDAEGA